MCLGKVCFVAIWVKPWRILIKRLLKKYTIFIEVDGKIKKKRFVQSYMVQNSNEVFIYPNTVMIPKGNVYSLIWNRHGPYIQKHMQTFASLKSFLHWSEILLSWDCTYIQIKWISQVTDCHLNGDSK